MNNDKSVLITRPEHDLTTRYLSKWSDEIVDEAKAKHCDIVDLDCEKANRERFIGTLEKKSPRFVILNGHGNEDVVCGHDNQPILEASDTAVEEKIIYARACKSAKRLGAKAIENGAAAYIGYDEDFIFMYEKDGVGQPLRDKTAALFLEPSNQAVLSILKGHTVQEADQQSKEKFLKNIQALFLGQPQGGDRQLVQLLLWDMKHQVCLGDKNASF